MKTLTALTAVAALVAGMSIASAQTTSPTVKGGEETQDKNAMESQSGSGMNSDTRTQKSPTVKSGAETQNKNAAQSTMGAEGKMNSEHKVFGKAKFCITEGRGGGLKCTYKTMASCGGRPSSCRCISSRRRGLR